jgi:phosphoribosyl 1,2-cyclic phosphodiesterase
VLQFRAHASSSAGNFYTVSDGETTLAIECGLPVKQIQRALKFKVTGLAGCLISHGHADHAKSARDLMKAGIHCYLSADAAEHLGLTGHRLRKIQPGFTNQIGSLKVTPFDVQHDAPGPLGFLVTSILGGSLLYVTDTPFVRYRFAGLTHVAVEANYSLEILRERLETQALEPAQFQRVVRNHLSLERCLDLLKANDLSQVEEIHLLHLSDGNSDELAFKTAVQRATGKPVYVAAQSTRQELA